MLNPVAGAGSAGKLERPIIRGLESRGLGPVELVRSNGSGMLHSAARSAAELGAHCIVAVGGDGTINEVMSGIVSSGRAVTLGVVNAGTGCGFAQAIGLPRSLHEQLDVIASGGTRMIDVAVVSFEASTSTAKPTTRYFINECEIGVGSEIIRRTVPALKRLGGTLSFGLAALSVLPQRRGHALRIGIDGRMYEGNYFGITIANGRFTGGGMQLAPSAKLDDGLLDSICFKQTSIPRKVHTFSQIYSGMHVNCSSVDVFQGPSLHIGSDTPVAVALDGELLGVTPCAVSILPSALRVSAPTITSIQ